MTSVIRRFSGVTEFVVVLLVCYWWAIAANAGAVAGLVMQVSMPVEMDDGRGLTLVAVELVGLAVALRAVESGNSYGSGSCTAGTVGVSSRATIELLDGSTALAEVHWYEAHGVGRREMKIKRRPR